MNYIAVRISVGPIGVGIAVDYIGVGVSMVRVCVTIRVRDVLMVVRVCNIIVPDTLLSLLIEPSPKALLNPVAPRPAIRLASRWAEDESFNTMLVDVVKAVSLDPIAAGQGTRLWADRITDEGPSVSGGIHIVPCATYHTELPTPIGHR